MHPFGSAGGKGNRENLAGQLFKHLSNQHIPFNIKMRSKLTYLCLIFCIPLCSFLLESQQENQSPVVKLISPKNTTTFDWDVPVSYKITVSDKEDGESKFDEINPKEVLLEVSYIPSRSKGAAGIKTIVENDPPGLAVIRASNCFTCHNFNSKSLGPSFYDMSKRYPATKSNIDSLTKHIKEGSAGMWEGREKMPAHPELTPGEIKSMVQWILKNGTDPNVNYYTGTEGTFRIKPPASKQKGMYVLTASYMDHGLKSTPGKQRLKGQDVVMIHGK
jgi:cytochrome c